ncbi:MAG: hypothetical protein HC863_02445, partial [Myxococcales bacterium]|nr:hypothetical protein [Myxococcales bacterium]
MGAAFGWLAEFSGNLGARSRRISPSTSSTCGSSWPRRATPERWLAQVQQQLDLLLIDHAHCEKKAAGVAMNLLFSYVEHAVLTRA